MINNTNFLEIEIGDLMMEVIKGRYGADYILEKGLEELERIARVELNERVRNVFSFYEPEESNEELGYEDAKERYEDLLDYVRELDEKEVLSAPFLDTIKLNYGDFLSSIMGSNMGDLIKQREHGYRKPHCDGGKSEDLVVSPYPDEHKPLTAQTKWKP